MLKTDIKKIMDNARIKENKKVYTYSISETLHAEIKAKCEKENITLNRLIEELFKSILE